METGRDPYDQLIIDEGIEASLEYAIEECAELITAIQHCKRGRPHNLAEEIGDVQIMLARLELFLPEAAARRELKLAKLRSSWLRGKKGG